MMTRKELVATLQENGVDVGEPLFRSWVAQGILPPAEQIVPSGAKNRRALATYPPWMCQVVRDLFLARRGGASLEELKRLSPAVQRNYADAPEASLLPVAPVVPRSLRDAVTRYAGRCAARSAVLTIEDANGRTLGRAAFFIPTNADASGEWRERGYACVPNLRHSPPCRLMNHGSIGRRQTIRRSRATC